MQIPPTPKLQASATKAVAARSYTLTIQRMRYRRTLEETTPIILWYLSHPDMAFYVYIQRVIEGIFQAYDQRVSSLQAIMTYMRDCRRTICIKFVLTEYGVQTSDFQRCKIPKKDRSYLLISSLPVDAACMCPNIRVGALPAEGLEFF